MSANLPVVQIVRSITEESNVGTHETKRPELCAGSKTLYEQLKSNDFREVEDGMKDIREQMDRMDGRLREAREEWRGIAAVVEGRAASRGRACANGASPKRYGTEPQPMKPYLKLAVLLLAAACSSDVITPDGAGPWWLEPANRAPEAVDEIPAQRLPGPGKAVAVAVGAHFTDPDGDTLTFAASSADTAVVAADVDGDTLRLAGGATGGAGTVTVTATDPSGLSVSVSVAVTVNRAPVLSGEIPAQSWIERASSEEVNVSAHFTDPDGDALTFAASSADTAVVRVSSNSRWDPVSGWWLAFEALAVGEAAVTVTARDSDGLETLAVFAVEVTENHERAALAALYEATDGPNWTNNENWLTDAPLGEWHGVTVGDDGRVSRLDLGGRIRAPDLGNGLSGPIPPELGNLASLRTLNLGGNALTGSIPPELGNLASLEELDLAWNPLTGPIPPELGNLASLEELDLHGNPIARFSGFPDSGLTGSIPPELGNLASLKKLTLRANALTGSIPPELGNLASLEELDLGANAIDPVPGLSGPIPPELGNLTSLRTLDLDGNGLTGPIPPELGNLASLRTLNLGGNGLSGSIPPELGNLASLEGLNLASNALTGPIPPELSNLASLRRLNFDGNPGLCVPDDPQLRTWMTEKGFSAFPCSDPASRLLPRALLRANGNGLSLALPDSLRDPAAVNVSDLGVVAATVADGRLELVPRGIGRTDVELVPSGGGSPAVAGVSVRKAVGTFGIDIAMVQPAPLGYEETMVAAADWWSSVLDGTEWEDIDPGFCGGWTGRSGHLVDDLVIQATADPGGVGLASAITCRGRRGEPTEISFYYPAVGFINVSRLAVVADVDVMKHEIGHVLGLASALRPLMNGQYFTGPRAVEAYRAGGGDPGLPGVPIHVGGFDSCRCHWDADLELMTWYLSHPTLDGLSLAALADAGYTVDMTKATPWRAPGNAAAAAMARALFRDVVEEVRIVPDSVPEPQR